MFLQFFDKRNA